MKKAASLKALSGCLKGIKAINAVKGLKAAAIEKGKMVSFQTKRSEDLINKIKTIKYVF